MADSADRQLTAVWCSCPGHVFISEVIGSPQEPTVSGTRLDCADFCAHRSASSTRTSFSVSLLTPFCSILLCVQHRGLNGGEEARG